MGRVAGAGAGVETGAGGSASTCTGDAKRVLVLGPSWRRASLSRVRESLLRLLMSLALGVEKEIKGSSSSPLVLEPPVAASKSTLDSGIGVLGTVELPDIVIVVVLKQK